MKKILLFIITFCSMFILVSCKKNEAVARDMNNFLSDFEFESVGNYNQYEAICKAPTVENKMNKLGVGFYFGCKTKKKIIFKSVSYTLYNTSETDSLYFCSLKDYLYEEAEDENYVINSNMYDQMLNPNFEIVEIKPGQEVDVKLDLIGMKMKRNKELLLFFRWCPEPNLIGGNIRDNVNLIKEYGGISNFKMDYQIYMKI